MTNSRNKETITLGHTHTNKQSIAKNSHIGINIVSDGRAMVVE